MASKCQATPCDARVPRELEGDGLCLHHFIRNSERGCDALRREIVRGELTAERRVELEEHLGSIGSKLAAIATAGYPLADHAKSAILNTLLLLMNVRESLEKTKRRTETNPISSPILRA
jgi:hypothetical protein